MPWGCSFGEHADEIVCVVSPLAHPLGAEDDRHLLWYNGSGYVESLFSWASCTGVWLYGIRPIHGSLPPCQRWFFFQTTHLGRFTSADCFVPASARPNKFIASFPLNLFNAWNAHMKMYVQKTRLLPWSQRQKYYWHLCAYFAGLFGSRWISRTLVWKLLDLQKRGPTLRK